MAIVSIAVSREAQRNAERRKTQANADKFQFVVSREAQRNNSPAPVYTPDLFQFAVSRGAQRNSTVHVR